MISHQQLTFFLILQCAEFRRRINNHNQIINRCVRISYGDMGRWDALATSFWHFQWPVHLDHRWQIVDGSDGNGHPLIRQRVVVGVVHVEDNWDLDWPKPDFSWGSVPAKIKNKLYLYIMKVMIHKTVFFNRMKSSFHCLIIQ